MPPSVHYIFVYFAHCAGRSVGFFFQPDKQRLQRKVLVHEIGADVFKMAQKPVCYLNLAFIVFPPDFYIQNLQQQVQRLRSLQDQMDELGALRDSTLELERGVERSV